MALTFVYNKFMTAASTWYKRSLAVELNKMGLQYEDLLISEDPAVQEAIELADPEVIKGRYRRMKRASDLCLKHINLQDYAPNMELDPFKRELRPLIEKIEARDRERARLDLHLRW